MARSYYAKYWSTDGKTLCGGVMKSESCRFGRREDAERMLVQAKEYSPGHCKGEVVESERPPEIFIHCGVGPPQAVRSKCFRCHKVLTQEDAVQAGYEHEVRETGIEYGAHCDLLTDPDNPDAELPDDWEKRYNRTPLEKILPYIPVEQYPKPPKKADGTS